MPVLLLSARAGQEASIEGLQAGADDYLVKPFAAAELLARVRANIELARLRSHQARWRTALVDSLQEAFFVCDEHGAVVEINNAFTEILGYGPEQPAVSGHSPVVAGRRDRPRSSSPRRSGVRANDGEHARRLHRSGRPPRRAPGVGGGKLQPRRGSRLGAADHGRNPARCHRRALPRATPDRTGRAQSATGSSRYGRRRAARSGRGAASGVAGTARCRRDVRRHRQIRCAGTDVRGGARRVG